MIAHSPSQTALFQQEFPQVPRVLLPVYSIRYPIHKELFWLRIAAQVPQILRTIQEENRQIAQIVHQYEVGAIISDNRFGCYHPQIPSVFITHQLAIRTGWGMFANYLIRILNYRYIHRFHQCWIPDAAAEAESLAGSLSHPSQMPRSARYIGWLSAKTIQRVEKQYDIGVVLSGPEPQRTLLEEQLLSQLRDSPYRAVLVRGVNGDSTFKNETARLAVVDFLSSAALQELIQQCDIIVSRSGYSSIMDWVQLQQKALLIPTPGQTEQEYLAGYLQQKGCFPSFPQNKFQLATAMEKAKQFPFRFPAFRHSLEQAIDDLLSRL